MAQIGDDDCSVIRSVTITRDGPQNVMRPASFAEWRAVGGGILVPDYYFRCQEASGSLVDDVQGETLAPSGAPGYQQAFTGWTSKCVTTVDGTSTQGFGRGSNALWNVIGQSIYAILYAGVTASTALNPLLMLSGASVILDMQSGNNGHFTTTPNNIEGAVNMRDSLIHPWVVEWIAGAGTLGHAGAGRWRISTDKEQRTATWASGKGDNFKGLGAAGKAATTAPTAQYNALMVWIGAKADAMAAISGGPKSVLQTFGWTVTGY